MRAFFVVNSMEGLEQSESTLALLSACAQRGNECYLSTISEFDLGIENGLRCLTRRVGGSKPSLITQLAESVEGVEPVPVSLRDGDVIFVRTNPSRDLASSAPHQGFLDLLRVARGQGVLVINDPDGLAKAASRVYLEHVPSTMRPRTVITRQLQTILDVAQSWRDTFVLKSMKGTSGRDVFRTSRNDMASLRQIAEILLREGYVVVQEFLPLALEGDLRVLVLEGQLLEIEGRAAAIHRTPVPGDFRRNLDAGGQARLAQVSDAVRAVVTGIGEQLVADGLLLCGMDFVGDKLVEINVFSPGGLWHAQEITGAAFSDRIVAAIEERLVKRRTR